MQRKSAEQIWEAALGELQIQVNKPNYHTWLAKTAGLSYQDEEFVIAVPNTFVAEYLDKNQRSLIEKVLARLLHHEVQVLFQVETKEPSSPSRVTGRGKTALPQQPSLPLFNPRYTFDSFIVGRCNQLAYDAALRVAQNLGQSYNPLFIYGEAGLGKTHLLQAIGQAALAQKFQVLYVSAEQFTNEFVSAIQEKQTGEFRNKYRSADVLLVDDVQFFSGKEQTRENFFHTFDRLHHANHQIAVTSDRSPSGLPLLPERLRSRFEWGLVTEIESPDFATRLAILQAKANEKELDVSPDVLELIAINVRENVRALEGSLNRVVAYAQLFDSLITPELATKALEDIANKKPKTAITPRLVIEVVASSFRLTPQELTGKKRDKITLLARQIAMYLIRQETDYSLTQIGQELGGRDHHIVSQACQKLTSEINSNSKLKDKISALKESLYSPLTPK